MPIQAERGDMKELMPQEMIERRIYLLRGHKVMLSMDLAKLYGVLPKRLNEQVKRNMKRFPDDFMFQLNDDEYEILKSQIATSRWGGMRRANPYAFTEQGVAMLSSVLNSERAIQVNIVIMRAFVKLRQILSTHRELAHKLNELERKVEKHDADIQSIFEAIRQLMAPKATRSRIITGFKPV
ncbi:MAG: ORF6N domain-containing protein [Candidatus Omnitrophota bacterium]